MPVVGGGRPDHGHIALGALSAAGHREHHGIALPYPGDVSDRAFDIVGRQVAAADDQHLLAAPDDEQLSVAEQSAVTGVVPAAGRRRYRTVGVPVAGHQRVPADPDVAHRAGAHLRSDRVDDRYPHALYRRAAGDHRRIAAIGRQDAHPTEVPGPSGAGRRASVVASTDSAIP